MNAKLLLKMVFLITVLLLLVLIGMHNRAPVEFWLPPVLQNKLSQPAAIMFFAFFAVGLLTGAILTAGGKKGSSSSKPSSSK